MTAGAEITPLPLMPQPHTIRYPAVFQFPLPFLNSYLLQLLLSFFATMRYNLLEETDDYKWEFLSLRIPQIVERCDARVGGDLIHDGIHQIFHARFEIDLDFRGKGLGSIILEKAIEQVYRDFGRCSIALGCHINNVGEARFYQRHGFRNTGVFEGTDEYYLRLI